MKLINKLLTPKKSLVFIFITFAFLLITNGEPYYRSDAWGYYTISKNIIDKNSFVSETKPEYYDYMEHAKETYKDKYISVYSPGTAILQLPGLIIANFFKGDRTIYNDYFMAYNGHTLLEGIMSLITAMFFGIFSLILIYKTLRNLKFSEKISILSTGAVFISSYAIWYIFLNPAFTHIYELFAVSAILYFLVKYQKHLTEDFDSARIPFLLGVMSGLALAIRPTLIPISIVAGLYFIYKRRWKHLMYFILGGVPIFLVWALYNYSSYGSFIASGYGVVRGETFNFSEFNGFKVLFSQFKGWLIYSPIYIFSIAGLILLFKKNKLLSVASLISIFSSVIIYGFWPNWWGGGSYGSRFMIFAVPLGVLGLAYLLRVIASLSGAKAWQSRIKPFLIFFITLSTLYSTGLVLLYRITVTAKLGEQYQGTIEGMYAADRYTPFQIYESNINLIRNSKSITDYFGSLYKNVNGGSGILAILTGTSNGVLRIDDREANVEKLLIITPPIFRRPLPEKVEGYYKTNESILYSFELNEISSGDSISFICEENCVSLSDKLRLQKVDDKIENLPTGEYTSIITNKGHFYFMYVSNLQFRGLPENMVVGSDVYKL